VGGRTVLGGGGAKGSGIAVHLDAAAALARRLMERHGLDGWTLVFDNAKTRAGVCRFEPPQIGLSQPLTRLHDEAEVRDTILHEIAHALVGPGHSHDSVWVTKARAIGCSAMRCVSSTAPRVEGDWVGTCPAGHVLTRHRRPERVLSCLACGPCFSTGAVYSWTYRGEEAPMHPVYLAELAQLGRPLTAAVGRSAESGALIEHRSGRAHLPVGTPVVIDAIGPLAGRSGRIFKRGRTRYQVLTSSGVISVHAISVRVR
jgi:hypothetical protein